MIVDPTRNYLIAKMQSKIITEEEFDFDHLSAPPLYSLLSPYDMDRLYNIASSIRYAGNTNKKYEAMNQILNPRGFVKLSAGTNRVAYRHQELDNIIIKVAFNYVGIRDSPDEFKNQSIFKPFVTKVFEVSEDGTVGYFERVKGIVSREEFVSIAADVFEVISNWFVGEYILADIGTKYFMNWGYRSGFGPVLLDFPYCYKLDGNKLFCSTPEQNNPTGYCGGVIDYDDGYNNLYCKRCGAKYRAQELAEAVKANIIKKIGGKTRMKVGVKRGNKVYYKGETEEITINEEPSISQKRTIQQQNTITSNNKSKKNNYNNYNNNSYNKNNNYPYEKRYTKNEIKNMKFEFKKVANGTIYAVANNEVEAYICNITNNIYTADYVDELINERKSLEEQINDLSSKVGALKRLINDKDKEISELQESLASSSKEISELQENLNTSREFLNETLDKNSEYEFRIDDITNKVESGRLNAVEITIPKEDNFQGISEVVGFVSSTSKIASLINMNENDANAIDDKPCIVLRTSDGEYLSDQDEIVVMTGINNNSVDYLHRIEYYYDEEE